MQRDERRESIRKILQADVQAAIQWRDVAAAKFDEAMHPAPGDEAANPEKLERVSNEYNQALMAFAKAVERLDRFLVQGVIPPGLLPKPKE